MTLQTFQCRVNVKTSTGRVAQTVQVMAANYWQAKLQLQALYGHGSLLSTPQQVR
jgi:hypothetical protein